MTDQLTKAQYRIIFCSGEDPEFPISNLICDLEPGWQSIRFSSYPQILLLQFLTPDVIIKELKITSHQSKISSFIELFACCFSDIHKETNKIKFRKIGEMRFSNNEENEFKKREVQIAHIDRKASYFKFIFHENYENPFNPFKQIGIINISIKATNQPTTLSYLDRLSKETGINENFKVFSKMSEVNPSKQEENSDNENLNKKQEISNIKEENEKNKEILKLSDNIKCDISFKFPDFNYSYKTLLSSILDEKTSNKYKSLELEKKEAVEREDFDKAQIIKSKMDQILFYGPYSLELQERTQKALEQEDFDSANILKAELQRMQNNIKSKKYAKGGFILRQQKEENNLKSQENFHKSQQNFKKNTHNFNMSPIKRTNDSYKKELIKGANYEIPFNMSPIKNREQNYETNQIENEGNQNSINENNKNDDLKKVIPKKKADINDTLKMSDVMKSQINENNLLNQIDLKKIPPIEEAPDLNEIVEEISAEQKALCSPFLGLLGEDICYKLFHEKWQKRELGLLEFEKRVIQDPDFKKSIHQNNSSLTVAVLLTFSWI